MTRHKSTLVLNGSWQPIGKVCWKRAFILIFKGEAKAIEYYDDIVKTPSDEFYVPAVVHLTSYFGFPRSKVVYSKRLVKERDNYICQYCSRQLSRTSATIDHVIPRSRGGKSTFVNTVTSCEPCNKLKADKPLVQSKVSLVRQPKEPYIHPLKGRIIHPQPEWKEYLTGVI